MAKAKSRGGAQDKPAGSEQAEAWRNRIIGEGEESPDQLLANPWQWKVHPKAQQDAIAGVLSEVGWIQRVIVNDNGVTLCRSCHAVEHPELAGLVLAANGA